MLSLRLPSLRSQARTFASTARAATNIPVRAVEAEGQSHVPAERPEGAVTQAGVVSGAPGAYDFDFTLQEREYG